ncbi:hypothetical protein NBRC110019_09760 [Neptunitalea chrysea]|uniref:Secreted protein n=1 Tax=Neptunitalea chrysea TaxID=1647581 RepID=A0A9W6EUZ8_9FLAO|nr:hypothetical protein [Neptunitalea chrysea]GLB51937.1 hypothetical protein NBRC110019_09760 [Neptunitalea chrysea]
MRSIYIKFSVLFLLSASAFGQVDGSKSGNVTIKAESDTKTTLSQSTSLLLGEQTDTPKSLLGDKKDEISMLPKEQFLSNNNIKIANKINKSLKEGSMDLSQFKRDQFLGDVKTNSKKLKIICRDYQYVDGDRIKIMLNDTVVKYNMILEGGYHGFEIDIPSGFNKLDFIALNMGTSFPNTAELLMYDDNDQLVTSSQWNLYTGFMATLVVVKD